MNRKEKIEYYKNFDYHTFINNPKVAAFIGKDYDYFKNLWAKDFEKTKGNALKVITSMHWTWLGLICGPIVWYSYRKMYKTAWGILGIFVAASFAVEFFDLQNSGGGYAGAYIVLAVLAKGYYFQHVVEFFNKNADLPQDQLNDLIAKEGGTSIMAPIVIFIIGVICMCSAEILGDLAAGHEISFFAEAETAPATYSE